MKKATWITFQTIVDSIYCLVIIASVVIPLFLCLINSFKSNADVFSDFIKLPQSIDLSNYKYLFENKGVYRYLSNSFTITTVATCISMLINPFIAFKIANNWDKNIYRVIFFVLSSAMFIPSQVIFFPLIKEYYSLGLMNTTGLIIYYAVFMIPESVFLYVPYFRMFNKQVSDAAYLDGCSDFDFYVKIFLPICKPIILTVMILTVIWIWNDFFMPLMILNKDPNTWTMPIFVYNFIGKVSSKTNYVFASCQIALIPIVTFYFVFHKEILNGFEIKPVK